VLLKLVKNGLEIGDIFSWKCISSQHVSSDSNLFEWGVKSLSDSNSTQLNEKFWLSLKLNSTQWKILSFTQTQLNENAVTQTCWVITAQSLHFSNFEARMCTGLKFELSPACQKIFQNPARLWVSKSSPKPGPSNGQNAAWVSFHSITCINAHCNVKSVVQRFRRYKFKSVIVQKRKLGGGNVPNFDSYSVGCFYATRQKRS